MKPVLVTTVDREASVLLTVEPLLSEMVTVSGAAPGIDSAPAAGTTTMGAEEIAVRQPGNLAQVLENTGVGAYLGAAPNINDSSILAAAGSIATIEARHSGYLNVFLRDPITGNSADDDTDNTLEAPLTPAQGNRPARQSCGRVDRPECPFPHYPLETTA